VFTSTADICYNTDEREIQYFMLGVAKKLVWTTSLMMFHNTYLHVTKFKITTLIVSVCFILFTNTYTI